VLHGEKKYLKKKSIYLDKIGKNNKILSGKPVKVYNFH
jgi:hypothetical protein